MDSETSGYYSGFVIFFRIIGILFFCVCWILWCFMRRNAIVLFGTAMLFGAFANSLLCLVLGRMEMAGYDVGSWRWFIKDFKIYSEYWRIAPTKGWSRWSLGGAILCFGFAGVFLIFIPAVNN